ncbi:NDR1/HIN1-like protein 13 [Benincasa hispida]|uniref:NDR1/HIN1-like protein 13 n=1 Tax=Benincasa hispida TaxID=102211 RepID=UPI00190185F2|nr:NDR1/HIN1-like protein 13 [Benincasa hispida]
MDVLGSGTPFSSRFCCEQICTLYTLKRFCFFLFVVALFSIIAIAIAALPVIFLLKPREPIFSLQSLRLDWYNITVRSGSPILSSVFTLTLNSQNPNKIGIKYSPARLLLIYDGTAVIGTIRVPEVFQPARSVDQSVRTRLLLHQFDVDLLETIQEFVEMKIIGDVGVELFVLHMAVIKMKVALKCDVDVDYRKLNFREEILGNGATVEKALDSIPSNSKPMSTNCGVAFYL